MIRLLSILVCIAYFAGFFFFKNYTDSLHATRNQYPSNLDAVVLFTGGHGRLQMAADYLSKFPNEPLLITGVHSEVNMEILFQENILKLENSTYVQLDYQAKNTIENVHMVNKWSKDHHYTNIGLITSNYHVPRSLLLFDRITPSLKIEALPVQNTKTSLFYLFKEYNKYLYTYILFM